MSPPPIALEAADTHFPEGEGQPEEDDDVVDLQAGHSSHVAATVYARDLLQQPGVLHDRQRQFRLASLPIPTDLRRGWKPKRAVCTQEAPRL